MEFLQSHKHTICVAPVYVVVHASIRHADPSDDTPPPLAACRVTVTAALAGGPVVATSTINYSAPEVIAASAPGARPCAATAAMDVWAFGVLAYELLLGRRAFPFAADERVVRDAVLGRKDAPWEMRRLAEGSPRLRRVQGVVEACMSRDPERRPPAVAVANAMRIMQEEFPARRLEETMPRLPTA